MKRTLLILVALVAVVCLLPGAAAADSIDYVLNVGNSSLTGAGFNSPYGTVNVDVTGGQATITLLLPYYNPNNYWFFDTNAFAISLKNESDHIVGADENEQISNVSFTTHAGSPKVTAIGTTNISEFGDFDISIKLKDGPENGVDSISFTLAGTYLSANDVLAVNSDGYFAAAHVYPPAKGTETGYAGSNTVVPLPGAFLLLGAGLARVVAYDRRRKG